MGAIKINRKIYLILGGLLAAALLLLFVLPSIQTSIDNNNQNTQSKEYYSKLLKVWMNIPQNFGVEDKGIQIILSKEDRKINVGRSGTNFNNVTDYLSDFDNLRNVAVEQKEKVNIDGNETIVRVENFPQQGVTQKVYYIYVDSVVFTLSTQSESLYADLDQIAQSFRYIP